MTHNTKTPFVLDPGSTDTSSIVPTEVQLKKSVKSAKTDNTLNTEEAIKNTSPTTLEKQYNPQINDSKESIRSLVDEVEQEVQTIAPDDKKMIEQEIMSRNRKERRKIEKRAHYSFKIPTTIKPYVKPR
jgi:hypothetical protein